MHDRIEIGTDFLFVVTISIEPHVRVQFEIQTQKFWINCYGKSQLKDLLGSIKMAASFHSNQVLRLFLKRVDDIPHHSINSVCLPPHRKDRCCCRIDDDGSSSSSSSRSSNSGVTISSRKSNSNLESPIKIKKGKQILLTCILTWCDRCSISKKRQQPALAQQPSPQKEEVRTKSFAGYTQAQPVIQFFTIRGR